MSIHKTVIHQDKKHDWLDRNYEEIGLETPSSKQGDTDFHYFLAVFL